MTSAPHAAYLRAGHESARGVLNAKTTTALSLEAANVACTLSSTHATLLCKYEFKSAEMTTVATFAAFEAPSVWQVLSFSAELPGAATSSSNDTAQIAATKHVPDPEHSVLPYSSFMERHIAPGSILEKDEQLQSALLTAAIFTLASAS